MTNYRVLRWTGPASNQAPTGSSISGGQPGWVEVAELEAHGAEDAIRRLLRDEQHGSGRYVAVAVGNFQPVDVGVETTRTVTVGKGLNSSAPKAEPAVA